MTAWCRISLFCSVLFLFPSTKAVENLLTDSNSSSSDVMKKIAKKCVVEYSLTCFKLDLLTVLHQLDFKSTFHLTSGILLTRIPLEDEQSEDLPRELLMNLAQDNFTDDTSLDIHLFKKIGNYLRSINLSFPLINDYYLSKMSKYFGITSVSNDVDHAITGRKKVKAVWIKWLVSITYAVAFGLLIGLVSKSFLLSIIALCLTLSSRFGNNAFGSPTAMRNNYEIIAHPLPQVQHLNTHSSEVKYEDDNSLSSSRPGVAYVYPRTMPHIEKVLAFHHLANLHKNYYSDNPSDVIGYKGYIAENPVKELA